MDDSLDLELPEPLLSGPFTRPMAAAAGVPRAALERMLGSGVLRRVLRGVYVAGHAPDTPALRAAALAHVVARDAVVVDRTAAWCHGLPPGGYTRQRLDVLGRRGNRHFGMRRRLAPEDLQPLPGLVVTTPLRTCADLGRLLCPDRALALLDAALRSGLVDQPALLAQLPRFAQLRGGRQLRRLAPLADARARDAAESVLRLRWLDARLPTPVPGLVAPIDGVPVRLAVALPAERFAVCLSGETAPATAAALRRHGWRLVEMERRRVLDSDAELVQQHLAREFHRHLLRAVG